MGHWTIAELAEQAAAVLARDDRAGTLDARTRGVPDPRTIRWYQTTGLIDRPETLRGRTALYGERHLSQLVAIKRLQAEGRSLAAIQAELVGASDVSLQRLAGLSPLAARAPRSGSTDDPRSAESPPISQRATEARPRFWTEPVAAAAATTSTPADDGKQPGVGSPSDEAVANQVAAGPHATDTMQGLRLAPGVVLLLEGGRTPEAADLEALRRAAGPLLTELTSRALLEEER